LRCDQIGTNEDKQGARLGAFVGVGNLAGGASGDVRNADGLRICGGIARVESSSSRAAIRQGTMLSLALGWQKPEGAIRPFARIGGWIVPDAQLQLNRSYLNGSELIDVSGDADGSLSFIYALAGAEIEVGPSDHLQPSIEIGRSWIRSDAYSEELSPANPFEANSSKGRDSVKLAKASLGWRHDFTADLSLETHAAWTKAFSRSSSLSVAVPGIGVLSPLNEKMGSWTQYGGRIDYRIDGRWRAQLFIEGTGGKHVGSSRQYGLSLSLSL
jgi:hypothetical protein